MLNDVAFAQNDVVSLNAKMPSISVLDVKDFTTKEDFIDKLRT